MTLAGPAGSPHATADDAVDAQLARLEARLVSQYAHYGHHDEIDVRDHFQRAAQHFANARIRSFLPILIRARSQGKTDLSGTGRHGPRDRFRDPSGVPR